MGKTKSVEPKEETEKVAKKTAAPKKKKEEAVETAVATSTSSLPAEQTQTFSSDLVSVSMTTKPNCLVELLVHTKTKLIQEAKSQGLKALAKDVSIPGFRKGKAPISLLEKRFPDAIKQETLKVLANAGWIEAQKLIQKPLSNQNGKINYDLKHLDLENGCDLVFGFESEPVVPEIDFSSIKVEKVEKEVVDEAKIDETVDQIRNFYATHEPILHRAVEQGDVVLLDIDNLEVTPPARVFSSMRFNANKTGMADWLLETITGMNPGEEKEAISKANETDSDQIKKEFEPKKVLVRVVSIEKTILPEINDELASKVGVKTVEEMRSQIQKQLEKKAEHHYQEELRNKMSDALISHIVFDIPKSIKESEFSHRFKQSLQDRAFKKEWDEKSTAEKEEFQKGLMEDSEKAVRLFYISRAIVERNNLRITKPQAARPTSMIEAMFTQDDMADFDAKSEQDQAYLMSKLLLQKAQDFAIEKCS
jgi:trigger factor